jgi:hypothetical protein
VPPAKATVVVTAAPVPTTPGPTPSTSGESSSVPAPIEGATTVHTGEPWAASEPYVVVSFALGGTLLGMGLRRRRHHRRAFTR